MSVLIRNGRVVTAADDYRADTIAEVARAPVYIVHLSCYDALTELRRAQARGVTA